MGREVHLAEPRRCTFCPWGYWPWRPVRGFNMPKEQAKEESDKKGDSSESSNPKKLKPCCACPETKQARDACIIENGAEKCSDLIEAHLKCMRDLGFKI